MSEGKTYINLNQKSNSEIGQFLCNLTEVDILTHDGNFKSIEGYIYFLFLKDNKLRDMSGWKAKGYASKKIKLPKEFSPATLLKIKSALADKIIFGGFQEKIKNSTLPFKLYWEFKGKIYYPPNLQFVPNFCEIVRCYLKGEISLEDKCEY